MSTFEKPLIANNYVYGAEQRLRLLMENISDHAILMLDPDGKLVDWNVGVERILGYKEDEIVGDSDASHRFIYHASIPAQRPSKEYTARIIPQRGGVAVPLETSRILWQR